MAHFDNLLLSFIYSSSTFLSTSLAATAYLRSDFSSLSNMFPTACSLSSIASQTRYFPSLSLGSFHFSIVELHGATTFKLSISLVNFSGHGALNVPIDLSRSVNSFSSVSYSGQSSMETRPT